MNLVVNFIYIFIENVYFPRSRSGGEVLHDQCHWRPSLPEDRVTGVPPGSLRKCPGGRRLPSVPTVVGRRDTRHPVPRWPASRPFLRLCVPPTPRDTCRAGVGVEGVPSSHSLFRDPIYQSTGKGDPRTYLQRTQFLGSGSIFWSSWRDVPGKW